MLKHFYFNNFRKVF